MRRRDERGAVGGLEGLAFGVVVFVLGTLVLVNAWGVVDAKMAVSTAAREAARAYVEGDTQETARQQAGEAATSAMAGHGRELSALRIDAATAGDTYRRCQPVVAVVETHVPRVAIPFMGRTGGTYTVGAEHREVVDPYRAGLAGAAECRP